jgi:hypothetical protein
MPMHGDCMTCTATFGNGVAMVIETIKIHKSLTHKELRHLARVFSAEAGTATRTTAVRLAASASRPITLVATLGFVLWSLLALILGTKGIAFSLYKFRKEKRVKASGGVWAGALAPFPAQTSSTTKV